MKKLFLGAAVAMSSLAFAQQFGIKGGMNVSSNSGLEDININSKSKIGFNAGLFMNAPIAENFSIQPEVLYNNLGVKFSGNLPTPVNNFDGTIDLDYISVPVMLQYNATPKFYLEAGPQFSFLINSSAKADNALVQVAAEALVDKDNLKSFDFGAGIGAGFWFTPSVGINARYVAGFSDIAKDRSSNDSNRAKNNNFQVGLSYKFGK